MPFLSETVITITATRFEELLESEIRANILKNLCLNEDYVSKADVERILGIVGGNKND